MSNERLKEAAARAFAAGKKNHRKFAVAESCTGGMVSAALTEISGASEVFERGFITYSNLSKTELLGVDAALIKKYGAVSKETATAMAEGALKNSDADMAVAITGVAGPDGGTKEKPVGLVYIALAMRDETTAEEHRFTGNRNAVRSGAALRALELLESFSTS